MELVITADSTATDLVSSLSTGHAQVHSIREDGTLRRRHFLTGKEREMAEWVSVQRTGQTADETEGIEAVSPRSMKSIATELHLSVSAIRRILIDLAITEELEDLEADELEAMLVGSAEEE